MCTRGQSSGIVVVLAPRHGLRRRRHELAALNQCVRGHVSIVVVDVVIVGCLCACVGVAVLLPATWLVLLLLLPLLLPVLLLPPPPPLLSPGAIGCYKLLLGVQCAVHVFLAEAHCCFREGMAQRDVTVERVVDGISKILLFRVLALSAFGQPAVGLGSIFS